MSWGTSPCHPEHLRAISDRTGRPLGPEVIDLLEARRAELVERARTLWHEGQPIGAFGLVTVAPEVVEAWSLLTEDAVHLPIRLVREVRAAIELAWRTLPIRRMEAQCSEGDWISYRWLGSLGFRAEGRLARRGARGEDVTMFGMTEKPSSRVRRG